jgi:hypothetical protein
VAGGNMVEAGVGIVEYMSDRSEHIVNCVGKWVNLVDKGKGFGWYM